MARNSTRNKRARARARSQQTLWMVGVVGLAVALVGTLAWVNLNRATPGASTPAVSDGRVWGQANAPIAIEIFSDFQCPFCARADAVLHQLAPKYLDTGKAKVTYRYFVFLGAESEWAAQAAECAAEQHKFWLYANYLFTHQAGENAGAFERSKLKQFAAAVGLDAGAFNACVDGSKYAAVVRQDTNEGFQRGVKSTPTFFVNGRRIEGLMAYDQFAALLDSLPQK